MNIGQMSLERLKLHVDCAQFLRALGIDHHPGFRWDLKLEGYHNFTFGCRAGPGEPNVLDLCHELAHAAQFGPRQFKRRALQRGFHFGVRAIVIAGRMCDEPLTACATSRELDTFAYQAHLLEASGLQVDRQELFRYAGVLLVRWMPDWYNIPGGNEQARRVWCTARAERFYQKRTQLSAVERLNGWLDKTAAHLARSAV